MDDFTTWLLAWHNLPFLLPLGISLGFIAIEAITGGLSEMLPALDIDFDVDTEFDADLDVDMGAHGAPAWAIGLGWMGFGKAPFTILIEVMLAAFGIVGLGVTAIVHDIFPALDTLSLAVAIPVAAVAAVFITRLVGMAIYKYIPPSASTVKDPEHYVGSLAQVVMPLSPKAGEVEVEGEHSPVFLHARSKATIPKGSEVVLLGYDSDSGVYHAESVA